MKKVASKKHCVWFLNTMAAAIQSAINSDSALYRQPNEVDRSWLRRLSSLDDPKRFDWMDEESIPVCLTWLAILQAAVVDISSPRLQGVWNYLHRTVLPCDVLYRCQLLSEIWWQQPRLVQESVSFKLSEVAETIGDRDLLEWLLSTVQPTQKKAMRYYATPVAVADSMIQQADQSFRRNVGYGIFDDQCAAEPTQSPSMVDPAAGSCVFPRRLLQFLITSADSDNRTDGEGLTSQVDRLLLQRLLAIDKDPLAALVGSLFFAMELESVGVNLSEVAPWSVTIGDALDREYQSRSFSLVIGNPPYAALTDGVNLWAEELMNGEVDGISYRSVPGLTDVSRKHWLHDDYIKFIRLGHYWINRAGQGVLCLVTNRAFLDSVGCQVLRLRLANDMADCRFIDLQDSARDRARGVRKTSEQEINEPVFGIGSGIAIAVLGKSKDEMPTSCFCYCKLSGKRHQKLSALEDLGFQVCEFEEPGFNWVPERMDKDVWDTYQQFPSVEQIFDQFWSAIVTARDRVVIDVDRQRLIERLEVLADSSIPDREIRDRFFQRSRSVRYPPGDTRSWKLTSARSKMINNGVERVSGLDAAVMPCLYRALDQHWIYYDSDWIDWSRAKDVQGLIDSNSVALVTRRSSPGENVYRYWAVTRWPAIDGALRSDNKGCESVFNLYRRDGSINVRHEFVDYLSERWSRQITIEALPKENRESVWNLGNSLLLTNWRQQRVSPETILCWLYARACRREFQTRYSTCLANGFPRIELPENFEHAARELVLGQQRIALELTTQVEENLPDSEFEKQGEESRWLNDDFQVIRRAVRFDSGRSIVYFNSTNGLKGIDEDVWNFRQGTHFVLEKLLKNRSGLSLSSEQRQDLLKRVRQIRYLVDWENANS